MNLKFLLLVYCKKGNTESYYADDAKKLKEYALFRKFDNYEIYELKKIMGDKSDEKRSSIE